MPQCLAKSWSNELSLDVPCMNLVEDNSSWCQKHKGACCRRVKVYKTQQLDLNDLQLYEIFIESVDLSSSTKCAEIYIK